MEYNTIQHNKTQYNTWYKTIQNWFGGGGQNRHTFHVSTMGWKEKEEKKDLGSVLIPFEVTIHKILLVFVVCFSIN